MCPSLSPQSFVPSTAPVQFPNSYLQELSACVGNGRAESEAALSQECEGRENYLLLTWGSALSWPCCHPGALGAEERPTQACNTSHFFIDISIFQFKFAEQMEEAAGSSEPSSHGRSHRVVPTGSTGSWLQPEPLSRAHSSVWVFATQDGWYLCKPSLPLFSVPTPGPSPASPRALKSAVLQFSAGQ